MMPNTIKIMEASVCSSFDELKANEIIAVLRNFHAAHLYIEIIDIRTDSCIIKHLESNNTNCVLCPTLSSPGNTDVIFSARFDEDFVNMLEEIIESRPR